MHSHMYRMLYRLSCTACSWPTQRSLLTAPPLATWERFSSAATTYCTCGEHLTMMMVQVVVAWMLMREGSGQTLLMSRNGSWL